MTLSPEEFRPLVEFAAERSTDGLLCLDTMGKILYANEAAQRTLGHPSAALLDLTIFDLSSDINPALWRELWKEIRRQPSFSFELALTAADDRQLHVDMTVYSLQPAGRELACVFFRDIEERKRLQTLQQEFVSTASHELRSPMTVIREGVSQVLEGLRGEVNESQRRALTLALAGIDRLARIVDELLDLSKMESGKLTLKRDRVDVASLAREVGATFQTMADDRRIDLRVTTPAGPVLVYADRDRLVQVLTNLINNSFKFTEKGHIHVTVRPLEGEAECSVTDTGMGLAPDDVEKIFAKFEQLGQVSVTGEKGTGLGLSISRGIVELHKGRIWAESAGLGKGACVAFRIPRQTGEDVFRDALKMVLRNVARRGGSLSTIIFRVEGVATAHSTEADVAAALAALEGLLRQQSGRKTDLLVKGEDALYVAFESTVKREASRTADKIVLAFKESLVRDKLVGKLRMVWAITGFPDEAANEEGYLEKVFHREAA